MKKNYLYTALGLMGIMGALSIGVVSAKSETIYITGFDGSTSGQLIQTNVQVWDDLELYFLSGDGTTVKHFTIMDRNLGATEPYNQKSVLYATQINTASFGYHYQWGNNYGFKPCINKPITNNGCNTISNAATPDTGQIAQNIWSAYSPSKYARNTWSTSGNWMASSSTSDNIWGGGGDTTSANADGTLIGNNNNWSDLSGRQGPCPENYYIPSVYDWTTLKTQWGYSVSNSDNGTQFASDLLLSPAGTRNVDKTVYGLSSYGHYWSSSPSSANNAYYLYFNSSLLIPQNSSGRSRGNLVRCAKSSPNTPTFTLHANGGTKAVVAFTGTVGSGKFTTLGTPTRSNSTFSGWYTASEGGEKLGVGSGVVANIYARWTCPEGWIDSGIECIQPKNTVTFDYSTNGGSATTSGSVEVISGDTLNLSLYTGTKSDWDFVGWNTSSGATTAMANPTITEPITLYAIFSKTLTGTYTATNATIAGNQTSDTCTMYNNDTSCSITLPSITCNAGYHTPTWTPDNLNGITSNQSATVSCTACGNGTYTEAGNTATSCTTCEAGYYCPSGIKTQCPAGYTSNTGASAENECYKILTATFNVNGATSVSSGSVTCKLNYGSSTCDITSPSITAVDGFTALGFNTDNTAETSILAVNTLTGISTDITYYAITKSSSPIKVTFDVNGNGGTTSTGECYRYNGSGSCSIVAPIITPAAEFTVIGWNSNKDTHTNEWTGGTAKTVTADATYYAQSSKAGYQVTVTYNIGTGVSEIGATSGHCDVDMVYNGSGYSPCDITLPTITLKVGYGTGKWTTGTIEVSPSETISLTGDDTYTASATPNTYSVKFDAGEGTGTMANQNFEYDSGQTLTANVFTKTGYTFSGWTDGITGYVDGESVSNLTGTNGATVTLTAQWTPITYTISFSGNAENATGTVPATINAEYDSGDIAPDNTFTMTGYTFTGWNTESNGSGTGYTTGAELKNLTTTSGDDVMLYAQWEVNVHKLNFVVDGTTIQSGDVAYAAAISAPAEPKKDCNSFAGWTSSVEGLTTTGTMPDSDVTFTANWNYTCSRSSGGGGSSRSSSSTANTQDSSTSSQNDDKTQNSSAEASEGQDNTQDSSANASEGQYSEEFQKAYEFAYKNGITTMDTIEKAEMDKPLTRIAMAKMLSYYAINVLKKEPDLTRVNKFNDISDELDAQYDNGVKLAYQLGIMGINMKNNKFRPNDLVTRAEFATALSRMLYGIADGKDKYYTPHLAKLMEEKIITNDDPKMRELRGYVMIMLMRSAENK